MGTERDEWRLNRTAHHELGHGFVATALDLDVYYVTIETPPGPRCLFSPKWDEAVPEMGPLTREQKDLLRKDLVVSVAGPMAHALFEHEGQRDSLPANTMGLAKWGGATDEDRFCRAFARLRGEGPNVLERNAEGAFVDRTFDDQRKAYERRARTNALDILHGDTWQRLTEAAGTLVSKRTMCGEALADLLGASSPAGGYE